MGFTYRKTGHTDEALDYYNRALNLEPKHLGANEYLGELYLELKQPDKAKERLAVLKAACGDCEEYQDLKTKIDQTAAN
jgi:tetratricopeptide (TPR) repeat protein